MLENQLLYVGQSPSPLAKFHILQGMRAFHEFILFMGLSPTNSMI
jgi:hypothetical protein